MSNLFDALLALLFVMLASVLLVHRLLWRFFTAAFSLAGDWHKGQTWNSCGCRPRNDVMGWYQYFERAAGAD